MRILSFSMALAAAMLGMCPQPVVAQDIQIHYRAPADAFEILDNISDWWPEYVEPAYRRFWVASSLQQPGDSVFFASYAQIRRRYFDRSGQSGGAPSAAGSGLFTDRAALSADPVGAAFYAADSLEDAFKTLAGVIATEEVEFLRSYFAHFRPRYEPLLAETRRRTALARVTTATAIADPAVSAYLTRVRNLFGTSPTGTFTALYVFWPDTAQTRANPRGQHLILRVRPAEGDTANNADVVVHEALHVYAAGQADEEKQRISAAFLNRCPAPAGLRRLSLLEEPLATALGNIEFRRRFQPRRFSWTRRWYGDDWVDVSARLLHPILTTLLDSGGRLDASFGRDAGNVCAQLSRMRGVAAQG